MKVSKVVTWSLMEKGNTVGVEIEVADDKVAVDVLLKEQTASSPVSWSRIRLPNGHDSLHELHVILGRALEGLEKIGKT